jgi:hypothetical protein
MSDERAFLHLKDSAQVTNEIVRLAADIVSGWQADAARIVWVDVWDRLDGAALFDGSILDLGCDLNSAALFEIRRRFRKGDY